MQPENHPPFTPSSQAPQPPRRSVNLIVVHCSASPSGKPLHQGTRGQPGYQSAAQVIDAWHSARGFRRSPAAARALNPHLPHIGYHYVIDLTGEVWTGRDLDEVGAHVAGRNTGSVGICMVGGLEPAGGRYSAAQWRSLATVVKLVAQRTGVPVIPAELSKGALSAGVIGHRDLSPDINRDGRVDAREWLKTCPGFDVRAWLLNGMRPPEQHLITQELA